MAMWRCPHCATPQPETSRCWVCKQSSTSCGTCLNFRRSIAPGIAYCGLDPRRVPLLGHEIRPCWEAAPERVHAASEPPGPAVAGGATAPIRLDERPHRDFVPVGAAATQGAEPQPIVARPRTGAAATTDVPRHPGLWDDNEGAGAT